VSGSIPVTPKNFERYSAAASLNSRMPLSAYPRLAGLSTAFLSASRIAAGAIWSGSPTPKSSNSTSGRAARAAALARLIFSNL
jgi:hypothetical protein